MATVSTWPNNPNPNPNTFLSVDPNHPSTPSSPHNFMSQQSEHLYLDTNSEETDSVAAPLPLPYIPLIQTSLPGNSNPTSPPNSLSSEPPTLLHVSFNQDFGCFSSGTDRGFRIYNCDPFREIFRRDFDRGGGIGKVEMLYRCNILALVGGGPDPQYPLNKVMIWDDHQSRCIGELSFRSEVRGVRLRRDRIVVVLEQKVFVYNFADLKLLHQIDTSANPKGLCEVSQSAGKLVLVCPGLRKGQVRVEHYASRKTKFIVAHDSRIACFALTQDGGLLATASSKGTLVRVYNTFDATLLQEVRRGADRAEIYSLAFSTTAQWLAVSSDKGTVHVFSLKVNSGVPVNDSPNSPPASNAAGAPAGSSLSFIRVSSNAIFKLGFFSPANSTNRYVGIWYNNNKDSESGITEVVWIANRDRPLNNSSGVLKISEEGNLQVLDEQDNLFWSSNISDHHTNNSVAELSDTGNLVLLSNSSGAIIWQSFDHLTHTLLPPVRLQLDIDMMKNGNPMLRSWKSVSDPSSGRFSLGVLPRNLPEFFTLDGDKPYWRSGPWNSFLFIGVPYMHSEVSTGIQIISDKNRGKLELSYSNPLFLERFVLNYDGQLFQEDWKDDSRRWEVNWKSFESECEVYGKCGVFGCCDPKNPRMCSCLKGFEPNNPEEWSRGNWSSGCRRRTPLQCGTPQVKEDKFLRLKNMKVPDFSYWVLSGGVDDCGKECLQNCSCLAYSHYTGIGCMLRNVSLIDIQQFSADGADLFIRLAHSEIGEPSKSKLIITIVMVILGSVVSGVFLYYGCIWMRQLYGKHNTNKEMPLKHCIWDDRMVQDQFQDLPLFKFEKLEVATNFFSIDRKIGQGGFGPVYKGNSEDGKEIVIKRLSRESGQGLQEFMNEVIVISKLQHKNLVRLLGCCVEKEEKLLVYEYMPNKSCSVSKLNLNHRKQLDWTKRFNIINGICRGLLYLHRDSRLKIIHRDLKASNILLDEDLNPKISDFGMARIFGTKQDQANTLRVVGTYGYMSPEYAMEGRFSEKSDVFSLGVLLLEIVSGRRNNSFTNDESLSLLCYAWKLWNENNILSLIDPTILNQGSQGQILMCIQLGLLCVQEHPEDRPTISALISMLDFNEVPNLPYPKQPGFTQKKDCSTDGEEPGSVNHVSVSVLSGR